MIIACINLKGGIGKTTTVVTLAQLWREQNPLIIDADEQHATGLFELPGIERIETDAASAEPFLIAAMRRLVLVDCPGLIRASAAILRQSDAVLLPVQCELLSLDASHQALNAIQAEYSELQARCFLTMSKNNRHSRAAKSEAQQAFQSTLCETVIPFRLAVSEASENGQTIIDYAPGSDAARAYRKLAEELQTWL